MEMKIISDTTVKITITLEDLEERDMELNDFLVPQEKTEEFFYAILDEIELPDSFKNSGMLSFRVTPKPKHIDVFVTKSELNKPINLEDLPNYAGVDDVSDMSPEELLQTLEKAMKDVSDPEAQARLEEAEREDSKNNAESEEQSEEMEELGHYAYVLRFLDVREVIHFAKMFHLPVELSELYKDENGYHLALLFDFGGKASDSVAWMRARLLELAKESQSTRAFLAEHAQLLISEDALAFLATIEYDLVD